MTSICQIEFVVRKIKLMDNIIRGSCINVSIFRAFHILSSVLSANANSDQLAAIFTIMLPNL